MNGSQLSKNIYKNEMFSKVLHNRFNAVRLRTQDKHMKYNFNFVAG